MATRPRPVPVRTIGAADPDTLRLQEAVREAIRPLQDEKRERFYRHQLPQDAAAADTTAEQTIWSLADGERLASITIRPNATIAANGTDYATIIIRRRVDGSPGETKVISRIRTSGTTLKEFQATSFPLAGDVVGGNITLEIEKAGAGVVVEASLVTATTDIPSPARRT